MELEKILPKDGPPIEEVHKYVQKYKNELIVIKYGGNVFIDREIFNNFVSDLKILNELGLSIIVVHGGGPRIKRELDKSNIKSTLISPGSLTTPSVMKKHPDRKLIDTSYIAEVILWLIQQPEYVNINEISLDPIQSGSFARER